jgi:hypothetical protein
MDWEKLILIENNSFRVKMPMLNVPGDHKLTVLETDNKGNQLKGTIYFNILASEKHR